jgi:hypothetical protein
VLSRDVTETGAARTPVLGADLERAFASGDPRLERLGMAGTSVCFHNRDAPAWSVTVLLDRMPPAVADGSEPAEVHIELTNSQSERLAVGLLALQAALLAGDAAFSGPVRKYLAVHSVLRALLIEQQRH